MTDRSKNKKRIRTKKLYLFDYQTYLKKETGTRTWHRRVLRSFIDDFWSWKMHVSREVFQRER